MATKTSKIENELKKHVKLQPEHTEDEDRSKYISRLVRGAAGLEDKVWAGMAEATQQFSDSVVEAINSKGKTPIPEFPDLTDAPSAEKAVAQTAAAVKVAAKVPTADTKKKVVEDTDDEPVPEADAPKVAAKVVGEEKADADAPPAPAGEKKKRGAINFFRKLQLEKTGLSLKELIAETVADGYTMSESTAYVVYYETRNTLKVLRELGKLPEETEEETAAAEKSDAERKATPVKAPVADAA